MSAKEVASMALGDRIKECRQAAHLSQEKVAELVGVSRQAVTKWEANQSAPNTENLFKLAEVLGTTVDFLIRTDNGTASVAEQVYRMFKEDEAWKEAEAQRQRERNWQCALAVAGAYLLIFLLCKIFWCDYDLSETTFVGWLTNTSPVHHEYLFGWLIGNNLYLFASAISILSAALGKHRMGLTTLGAFAIGLPLSEYLGSIPGLVPQGYHYGWAIWGGIFLGSLFFGIRLQRFPEEALTWKSRKLRRWFLFAALYIIGITALILTSIPPAYY